MKLQDLEQKVKDRVAKVQGLVLASGLGGLSKKTKNMELFFNAMLLSDAFRHKYVFEYYLKCATQLSNDSTSDQAQIKKIIETINASLNTLQKITKGYGESAESLLNKAIRTDDMELFDAALAWGAKVNQVYIFDAPLVLAAAQKNVYYINKLLEIKDIDVNIRSSDNEPTTLFTLCQSKKKGSLAIVDRLLNLGANVNCVVKPKFSNSYSTPLFAAVSSGQLDLVERLLKVPHIAVNNLAVDGNYSMALDEAIKQQNADIVTILLKAGAVPSSIAVRKACREGWLEIVTLLVAADSPNKKLRYNNLLVEAAQYGQQPIVECLLANGANIDGPIKSEVTGIGIANPLAAAIEGGYSTLAKYLINNGANIAVAKEALHCNDFTFAAAVGDINTIRNSLKAGSEDIDAVDEKGYTALMRACICKQSEVVQVLIDAGVNDKVIQGLSALILATQKGLDDIVKILLGSPKLTAENLDAFDPHGNTALMIASDSGRVDIVQVLIEAGAKVNVKNSHGVTALWQAINKGHVAVVKILLTAIDGNSQCIEEAKSFAEHEGHQEIVIMIEQFKKSSKESTAKIERKGTDHIPQQQIDNFNLLIQKIESKSMNLRDRGYKDEADCAGKLALLLTNKSSEFFAKSFAQQKIDFSAFKQECSTALKNANAALENPRGFEPIFRDIVQSLTLIGIILGLIMYANSGRYSLFPVKTDSSQLLDKTSDCLNNLEVTLN